MNKKAVLITGGARRIGAAMTRRFAAAGYDVALHYNRSEAEATALAEETGARLYRAELTAPGASEQLITAVKRDLSHLNTLINNASTFRRAYLKNTSEKSIAEDLEINLAIPMNLMREFSMAVNEGNIVNMLDYSIHDTHPAHFAYLIAKKGLADATQMASREWSPAIRVNGVCPGHVLPTETDLDQEPEDRINTSIESVVEAVFKLAEDSSLTGELMDVKDR